MNIQCPACDCNIPITADDKGYLYNNRADGHKPLCHLADIMRKVNSSQSKTKDIDTFVNACMMSMSSRLRNQPQ